MHACKQESCWFEPCVMSLLQQWLCAAHRAWHCSKSESSSNRADSSSARSSAVVKSETRRTLSSSAALASRSKRSKSVSSTRPSGTTASKPHTGLSSVVIVATPRSFKRLSAASSVASSTFGLRMMETSKLGNFEIAERDRRRSLSFLSVVSVTSASHAPRLGSMRIAANA